MLACLLVPLYSVSINLSIRIYVTDSVLTAIIAPQKGSYILLGDGHFIDSVTPANVYEIKAINNLVEIKTLDRELGKFATIDLKECNPGCSFNIKPSTDKNVRLYDDNLEISSINGYLKMLNMVELENYIAGVVECEGGYRKPLEFYKAQAIICRTYALNNLARHLGEYYELCDAVHCQVYKGAADKPDIIEAVEATKGLVIADSAKRLINAPYFSNCGGYTLNSEDVWSNYTPYLRSVKDTFCLNQPHARWEKTFTKEEWENYLAKKEATLSKTDMHGEAYWDSIPEERRIYLYDKGYLIPLKDMRLDLNLHSTYFHIEKSGDNVILKGRGNGHRVGLCQEGAIHMGELGYTYMQILNFYYRGIQVLNYTSLPLGAGAN